MSNQVESRFAGPHGDAQVVAIMLHHLALHVKSGTVENLLQIELDVFFLAGRRVNIQHIEQRPAQPLRVNGPPDILQSGDHGFFTDFFLALRVRLSDM